MQRVPIFHIKTIFILNFRLHEKMQYIGGLKIVDIKSDWFKSLQIFAKHFLTPYYIYKNH